MAAVRQRYALATGGGLSQAEGAAKVLKLAKGGAVKASAFKKGMNVSGKKGDDKFTTVTQKPGQLAKGFKVHRP